MPYRIFRDTDLNAPGLTGAGPKFVYGPGFPGELCSFEDNSNFLSLPLASYVLRIGEDAVLTSSAQRPRPASDRLFSLDTTLEDRCRFRSEGPLHLQVPATRYSGETNPDGTLRHASALIGSGMLAETCTLRIVAWDVDRADGERNRVLFNGERVEFLDTANAPYLEGANNVWHINEFTIPTRKVRFPSAPGSNGEPPQPANNMVTIEIDTNLFVPETWCTTVDWCELTIGGVMSPIVLVHGMGSDGGFFERQGFATRLNMEHLVSNNTIALPVDYHVDNAARLRTEFFQLFTEFGVDSLHVVAHSKGGLETRAALAGEWYASLVGRTLVSFSTLATPHNGSALADIVVQQQIDLATSASASFDVPVDLAWFSRLVASNSPEHVGYGELQAASSELFNDRNVSELLELPRRPRFIIAGGDADRNGNWLDSQFAIDQFEEWEQFRLEDPLYNLTLADTAYRTLRDVSEFSISLLPGGGTNQIVVSGVPTASPQRNDQLVTLASAAGLNGFEVLTQLANRYLFTHAQGRNHCSIADAQAAQLLLDSLVAAEEEQGDLQEAP